MRLFGCVLLFCLLLTGCPSHGTSNTPQSNNTPKPFRPNIKIENQDEEDVLKRYRNLGKPAHKEMVKETIFKAETQEVRIKKYHRNLIIVGVGLGIIAAAGVILKVLGAV